MDHQPDPNNIIPLLLLAGIFAAMVYFLPSIIAFVKGHANRWVILLINVFFGVTLLGWLIALIWALNRVHHTKKGHGGESGLNIFESDVKKISVIDEVRITPPPIPISDELSALKKLLDDGLITQEEFDRDRSKLAARGLIPSRPRRAGSSSESEWARLFTIGVLIAILIGAAGLLFSLVR